MKYQHVDPEEAVKIHTDVQAKKSVAIHWGTFALASEVSTTVVTVSQWVSDTGWDSGIGVPGSVFRNQTRIWTCVVITVVNVNYDGKLLISKTIFIYSEKTFIAQGLVNYVYNQKYAWS